MTLTTTYRSHRFPPRKPALHGTAVPSRWRFALMLAPTLLVASMGSDRLHGSTAIPGADQSQPIAIVGATVHPMDGPTLEDATVLFEAGRLTAIGKNVTLPDNCQTIEGEGQHVYPGLFCAGGELGLVEINSIRATQDGSEAGSINPNVKAQVAVNPDSELIPVTRANGVLLTLSLPSGRRIAGMAAVLQLDGWTWEDMTAKSPAALHIQWPRISSGGEPSDALDELDDWFDQAEHYRNAMAESSAVDVRLEAMVPVLEGKVPVIVSAESAEQIQSAVAFSLRRKIRLIIYGGYDAESCAALLTTHDVPVIIPSVYRLPNRRNDAYDTSYTLPERLRGAGVKFCIAGVDRFAASNLRNLPYHAATAVAYGLPRDEALRAITLYPAQILGIDDHVGSLTVGKDATLFISDGDPLDTETHVLKAFIQGREVELTDKHKELWSKYREKYRRLRDQGELPPLAE